MPRMNWLKKKRLLIGTSGDECLVLLQVESCWYFKCVVEGLWLSQIEKEKVRRKQKKRKDGKVETHLLCNKEREKIMMVRMHFSSY
jgi:hypothetical protein